MNKPYVHKGIAGVGGHVDGSQSLCDPDRLQVYPRDDGWHLEKPAIGDFQWWYFDIMDAKTGCVLKIVLHVGTDPMKRRVFPQLALSVKVGGSSQAITREYRMEDLKASPDRCDVALRDEIRIIAEHSAEYPVYSLSIDIPEFKAGLTFTGETQGWKPLGDKVPVQKGTKRGEFFWAVAAPKASVHGEFVFRGKRHKLENALGYHDQNYWKAGPGKKLFMDDMIPRWYWGKCYAGEYTVIFMEIRFKTHALKSLMVAEGGQIVHSSNNAADIRAEEMKDDAQLKTSYPGRLRVSSTDHGFPFQALLESVEVVDRRDLLTGVPGLLKWLIKLLVSKPSYHGMLAEATVKIGDQEIKGSGIYEVMVFRSRG
ncbi:hypothetical protein ACFL5V_10325 [Fibrobacterota bacterium]